ncbi:hypothetical protein [Nocardioides sp.]|uniref:hypothetical protein n=1 Tax=Nocardioides sp. TaxID=35761 RepID=UPI002C41AB3C|nr:hypothetical protein [Nocardioides sp.]HXH80165.1 hypothetical protein [Nocardioides sp.]
MVGWRRCAAGLLLAAALATGPTACGKEESPPSEQVPALARQLDKVDEAVEAGQYERARAAVEELVATTAQAQVTGELSSEQAERIFASAQSVLENLPSEDDDTEDKSEDDS